MPQIERICKTCGKIFFVKPYIAKKGFGLFCSRKCMGIFYENKIETACATCGKMFFRKPSEPNNKYCSYQCMGSAYSNSINFSCLNCGETVTRRASKVSRSKLNFCSSKCQYEYNHGENNPRWQGGITPETIKQRVSRAYYHWRKAVINRDNHTCRICHQMGGHLEAHHLYSFTKYPELRFNISNGHTLCHLCHIKITGYENEYLLELGLDPDAPSPDLIQVLPV